MSRSDRAPSLTTSDSTSPTPAAGFEEWSKPGRSRRSGSWTAPPNSCSSRIPMGSACPAADLRVPAASPCCSLLGEVGHERVRGGTPLGRARRVRPAGFVDDRPRAGPARRAPLLAISMDVSARRACTTRPDLARPAREPTESRVPGSGRSHSRRGNRPSGLTRTTRPYACRSMSPEPGRPPFPPRGRASGSRPWASGSRSTRRAPRRPRR